MSKKTKPAEGFSHLDELGQARMVNVADKPFSARMAQASGRIAMKETTVAAIRNQQVIKGDVLATARIAGIMAAKQTGQLIPLCHPLALDAVSVDFQLGEGSVGIRATAMVNARTGVEMEALTAVTVAALTIYDMCKSIDKGMVIEQVCLVEKVGGASGHYLRKDQKT
jgi:cyclic pyranopterin phosphate synthase